MRRSRYETLALTGGGTIINNNQANYAIVVHNTGFQAAAGVIVSTQVPNGSTLVLTGSSPGCTPVINNPINQTTQQITCVISSISASASAALYIDIQLPSGDLVSNTNLTFAVISQGGNLTPSNASVGITAVPPDTDGPLPLWALATLGAGLLGIASRRLKRAT
jgi:hypothetical protein